MHESIRTILADHTTIEIDPDDYRWQELKGSKEIITFAKNKEIRCNVTLKHDPDQKLHFLDYNLTDYAATGLFGYGNSYGETLEGVKFTDGSCLVCATISEWAGTFASHDNIVVQYYSLTVLTQSEKDARKWEAKHRKK